MTVGSRVLCLFVACVVTAPSAFAAPTVDESPGRLERLALAMVPTNELHEAMGFFGPVTKRYLPVFDRFNAEYLASADKMAVVRKYLPQANAAYAAAQRMNVPPKYEAQKTNYLRMFKAFLVAVRLTANGFVRGGH